MDILSCPTPQASGSMRAAPSHLAWSLMTSASNTRKKRMQITCWRQLGRVTPCPPTGRENYSAESCSNGIMSAVMLIFRCQIMCKNNSPNTAIPPPNAHNIVLTPPIRPSMEKQRRKCQRLTHPPFWMKKKKNASSRSWGAFHILRGQ
ncbi:hypothetical protein ACHAWF_000438 [Thalassiosira exigua]